MCKCGLDENARSNVGLTGSAVSGIMVILGFCLIIVAVYIKYQIEDKVLLFGTYRGSVLTMILIIVACIVILANAMASKVAFDSSYPETRNRFKKVLMFCLVLLTLCCLLLFLCAFLCYTHRYVIDRALRKGMSAAMKRYRTNIKIKRAVDDLQINFLCCGSQSYKDWFHVSWISTEYLKVSNPVIKKKLIDGLFITDDVPFSCCTVASKRPCIHHQVTNISMHSSYRRPTLYMNGCKSTLKLHFHKTVLLPTGHSLVALLFIEIMSMIFIRLLQTSIFSAEAEGDPEGEGEAFCCEYWPCQNQPMRSRPGYASSATDDDDESSFYDSEDADTGDESGGFPGFSDLSDFASSGASAADSAAEGGSRSKKDKKHKKDKKSKKEKKSKDKKSKKTKKKSSKKSKKKSSKRTGKKKLGKRTGRKKMGKTRSKARKGGRKMGKRRR